MVGIEILVLVVVVTSDEVAVVAGEVKGPVLVWINEVGMMIESVVWEDGNWTTEESALLGFCPGNVRTGS